MGRTFPSSYRSQTMPDNLNSSSYMDETSLDKYEKKEKEKKKRLQWYSPKSHTRLFLASLATSISVSSPVAVALHAKPDGSDVWNEMNSRCPNLITTAVSLRVTKKTKKSMLKLLQSHWICNCRKIAVPHSGMGQVAYAKPGSFSSLIIYIVW